MKSSDSLRLQDRQFFAEFNEKLKGQTIRLCVRASFSVEHLTKPLEIKISKNDLDIYMENGEYPTHCSPGAPA